MEHKTQIEKPHIALPLKRIRPSVGYEIYDANGRIVACCDYQNPSGKGNNIEILIRAANAHDELVEAARLIVDEQDVWKEDNACDGCTTRPSALAVNKLREALSKLEK